MADQSLLDLAALGTLVATDRLYVLTDPSGTPLDRYITGATLAEFCRDTIGAALVQAGLITITVDDAGNTITITSQDLFAPRTWLYLPGGANGVTTPDAAALDIAGDMEIVCRVALDDWTPATEACLVGKANQTALIHSWMLSATTGGALKFTHYNGAVDKVLTSAAHGFADGTPKWIKVTFDVDNGAAGHTATFYQAADAAYEPSSWTMIGTAQTGAGASTIANSAYAASVGMTEDGLLPAVGKFGRAIVRTGIAGTVVADCNLSTPWYPRLRDAATRVWSLTGSTYSWMVA